MCFCVHNICRPNIMYICCEKENQKAARQKNAARQWISHTNWFIYVKMLKKEGNEEKKICKATYKTFNALKISTQRAK